MIRCPYRIRPHDFETLEFYAETNPAMAEMAEEIAWESDRFSWGLFFAALREFRRTN